VPVAQEHQAIELPAQPPRWIAQPIDAEGIADRGPSPLRTKSAAETLATENLRARILALPLNRDGLTIRDAAERDPRVTEAVNRAMVRARILQTQYRADGSFLVRMTINPRDVWDELRRSMGQ
jgi:hypothetical protein